MPYRLFSMMTLGAHRGVPRMPASLPTVARGDRGDDVSYDARRRDGASLLIPLQIVSATCMLEHAAAPAGQDRRQEGIGQPNGCAETLFGLPDERLAITALRSKCPSSPRGLDASSTGR